MFLLLLACGTLYLILGDVHEALMLLSFVFVVLGITLFQERKTERAYAHCQSHVDSSPCRGRTGGTEVVLRTGGIPSTDTSVFSKKLGARLRMSHRYPAK